MNEELCELNEQREQSRIGKCRTEQQLGNWGYVEIRFR